MFPINDKFKLTSDALRNFLEAEIGTGCLTMSHADAEIRLGQLVGATIPKKAIDFEEFANALKKGTSSSELRTRYLEIAVSSYGSAENLAERILKEMPNASLESIQELADTVNKVLSR
jgi:hypothetical protein